MTDYANGKIYKIVDNTNNNVYIGSTCKTLKQRMSGHDSDYKQFIKGKYHYVTSFDIFKNDDYDIILIELFPCDYKDELLSRERYWTNKIPCINKNKPGLFNELGRVEWNKQYNKQYYADHKDHFKQYYTTKCDCICGGMYTLTHKSRHMKSIKHTEYEKSETITKCLIKNLSFEETYQKYKTL